MSRIGLPSVVLLLKYFLKSFPFSQASRLIFGNNAGLMNNLGKNARYLWRNNSNLTHETRLLWNKGFVQLENHFHDKDLINHISKQFQEEVSRVEKTFDSTKPKVVYAVPLLDKIHGLEKIYTDKINTLLDAYFINQSWSIVDISAWRNYFWEEAGNVDVNSDQWHNDEEKLNTIKLFIILSKGVAIENGATKIIDRIQTKKVMRRGYLSRERILPPAATYIANRAQINFMEGEIGNSFIFNPQICLHAAGRVKKNHFRDVICFTIQESKKAIPVEENFKRLASQQRERFNRGKSIQLR